MALSSFLSSLANSDWSPSADGLDPVPSGSIGGGGDVAMGVLETSLAALQTGSALIAKVPLHCSGRWPYPSGAQDARCTFPITLFICLER
jgi:hypothetical protein